MNTKGTTLKTKFLKSAGAAGAMAVALTTLAPAAMADDRPRSNTRPERGEMRAPAAPRPQMQPQQRAEPRPAQARPAQPTGGAFGYRGAAQQGQFRPQMQQQARPQGMPQGSPQSQAQMQPQRQSRPAHAWSNARPQEQGSAPQQAQNRPAWNGSRGDDNRRPQQAGNWSGRGPQQVDNRPDRGPDNRGPDNRGPDRRPDWAQNGGRPGGSYQGRPPQNGPDRNGPDRNRPSWQGNNSSWQGNRGNDHRWSNDDRRWNNDWRQDRRYDWRDYRSSHRDVYRGRPYYSPYRGYAYRRVSIGFTLGSLFYGNSYWLDDPWMYRLPPVYGSYRWVRYYDDVLLVDVYTGQVVDVIYDFFW